jgi:hypothetical protein
MKMGKTRKQKTRRKMGAALQAVGMLVMLAGLAYGVAINPVSASGGTLQASIVEMIAILTIGVFLLGFTIVLAGAWMARIADARFGPA